MTGRPMTAEELRIRSDTLFEFAAKIYDGAETIETFAAGSSALLVAHLLRRAGNEARQAAAEARAADAVEAQR